MKCRYAYHYSYRDGDYVLCGIWVVGDRPMLDIDYLFKPGFDTDEDWANEMLNALVRDGVQRTPPEFLERLAEQLSSYRGRIDEPEETDEFPNTDAACETLLARGATKPKTTPAES